MKKILTVAGFFAAAALFTLSGCTTPDELKEAAEAPETQRSTEAETAEAVKQTEVTPKVIDTGTVVRINCGAYEPYTDKAGNIWLADQDMGTGKEWGAVYGETADRGELGIAGTDCPGIYETERYSMDGYQFNVPNGRYTVRIHFAETYSGIYGEGERVFSVTINEKPVIEDFDPLKEAGGLNKPVVKTIPGVTVTGGEIVIGFIIDIQNPEINGIEIIPE